MVTWGSAIRSRGRGACPLTPLNWNPHSLLQISPTPTPEPSTQLPLVYSSYMYPPRSEERDSEKDGFKLDIFNKEAGINRVTGELLPPDWLGTKSCLYLIQQHFPSYEVRHTWSSRASSDLALTASKTINWTRATSIFSSR